MRNFLLAASAAVALYGGGVNGAVGQNSNDSQNRWLRVDNESALLALRIFIIPSGQDCCWSRDLMEIYFIEGKEAIQKRDVDQRKGVTRSKDARSKRPFYFFNFDDGSKQCVFDIRIMGIDLRPGAQVRQREWNFDRLNVCATHAITLKPDSDRPEPSKDGKKRQMTVRNDSSFEAASIFIIPSLKDCCWSTDLLGKGVTIPEKQSRVVDFDDGTGACEVDILVTNVKPATKQMREWNFDRINVCSENEAVQKFITLTGAPVPKDGKKREMTVRNDTNFKVELIRTIPAGKDCCWSRNLLESRIRGKQRRVVDFDDGSGECEVDIHVTGQGREWNLDRVDVCLNAEKIEKTITLK